jgi:hypothetical protein
MREFFRGWRRKAGCGLLVASVLIVFLACWQFDNAVRNYYAQWWVADMVTLHLDANHQQWPRSWDDLVDDYEVCVARSGRPWSFEELSERVVVDWNTETQYLRTIPPQRGRPPLFRVIWARYGSTAPLGRKEPNTIIAEYLRTHPRIPD